MFQIDIGAKGQLVLVLPGRTLDIPATIGGLEYITKIIKDHHNGIKHQRGYIGTLPTQHAVDKAFADKFLEEKKAKAIAVALEEGKDKAKKLNIDWDKLEIRI